MKVLWLIDQFVASAASEQPEQEILTSPIASARLRMGVASRAWKLAGHQNVFLNPGHAVAAGNVDFGEVSACVVHKFFEDSDIEQWLKLCVAVKGRGSQLVVDICDLPFHQIRPNVANFYKQVLKMCDVVVVNSEKMAELITPYFGRVPVTIEDAILGQPRKPEFSPGHKLELLWFGSTLNLGYLRAHLDGLIKLASVRRARLTILTSPGLAEELARDIQAHCAPAFEARFVPWSLESMRAALRKCDLVLLPSDPEDPLKTGASANRIAEALNAGRFPIASPLQSYLAFSDAAWLGSDLTEGVKWALGDHGEVLARIRRGQSRVAERFSAEKIGRQWRELFEQLA